MLYISANPEFGAGLNSTLCRAHVGGVRFPKGARNAVQMPTPDGLFNCPRSGFRAPSQKCAEPWMAEPKRHTDVPKERFLGGGPEAAPSSPTRGKKQGGT